MTALSAPLQQAIDLLKRRAYPQAEQVLRSLIAKEPRHADALQLLGLALKNQGHFQSARDAMAQSLQIAPEQPHVQNNLGSLLERMGDLSGAATCFETAVRMKPDYKDAWRNLASIYKAQGRLNDADQAARRAVSLDPSYIAGLMTLGLVRAELNQSDAPTFLQKATELAPNRHQTWHNLASGLRRMGRLEEAVDAIRRAISINDRVAESHGLLGGALQDLDRLNEAVKAFERAIELKPDYEEAHFALSQILFMSGQKDRVLKSYQIAEAALADPSDLRCAHARTLIFLDRGQEAVELMRKAYLEAPENLRVKETLARALAVSGAGTEAAELYADLVNIAPNRTVYRVGYARALIHSHDFTSALDELDHIPLKTAQREHMDQEIMALRHVCTRQLNLPEASYLYDYKRFVKSFAIPTPDGFESLTAFNQTLADRLTQLHTTQHEPIEQTLRGGTQTHGRLFDLDDPVIQALKNSIRIAVEQYISELPHDTTHPFLSRKPDACEFQASWSVRLRDGGFHKNHVHGFGWLSSAYYVTLPPVIGAAEAGHAGWLKLGQPQGLPGSDQPPEHWVEPKAGHLALFPSYMWHGTEAFQSDAPRMTVAFDIAPRPASQH